MASLDPTQPWPLYIEACGPALKKISRKGSSGRSKSKDMGTEKTIEASDDPFAFLESSTVMEEDRPTNEELIKKEVDTWDKEQVAE
ncbi:Hypothetical protein FKW44_015897, partial [Caligus rogercresseyi]